MRKCIKDMRRLLTKEEMWKANNHMKGYSTLLKIREREIKAVGYYLSSTRMGKMEKSDRVNVGKDMAKQEVSNTSEKSVNWYSDTGEKLSNKTENANNLHLVNSTSR